MANSLYPIWSSLNLLLKDLGAIGPAGETIHAHMVALEPDATVNVETMPANTLGTGTIDANAETVVVTLPGGCGTVGLQITGMPASSQLNFEGIIEGTGTTWRPVDAYNGLATINATAADGIFILPGAGYRQIRVRATAWSTGTATVSFIGSVGTAASILTGSLPAGTNNIGTMVMQSVGEAITLAALAARTTGGNGTAVDVAGRRQRFIVVNAITASLHEAGDTLDVYVDWSIDNVLWYNAVHFTQQAGNGAARTEYAVLDPANPGAVVIDVTADAAAGAVRPALFGRYLRARWAIVDGGDADSSHTFSVLAYAVT